MSDILKLSKMRFWGTHGFSSTNGLLKPCAILSLFLNVSASLNAPVYTPLIFVMSFLHMLAKVLETLVTQFQGLPGGI